MSGACSHNVTTPELHKPSRGVKILNPADNGHDYTSQASARSLVRRKRADWVDDGVSIRLTDAHRRQREAMRAGVAALLELQELQRKRIEANRGYDGIKRTMTLEELGNVPFAGRDLIRLLVKKR